jgi:uncharacterized membrane-anchored protein YitT (DUF2179 family)
VSAAPTLRHSALDDLQALVTGTLFAALGLSLFRHAGMVTGGTAGLALVLHYASGCPFGLAFFMINLPFYVVAWVRMGRAFTLKTIASVGLLSIATEALPLLWTLQAVNAVFAAIGGGLLIGAGMLMLFRHHASLGGINLVVLWLQERRGWSAGRTQLAVDLVVLLLATPWLRPTQLLLSVLGAAAMNFSLAMNHRAGRYAAL